MRRAPVERLIATLLGAVACMAGAAPLDTLFHTPQERERLDRLRRGEPQASATGPVGAAERRREITGYVKRSDGRGTAFIDGVPVPVDPRSAPLLQPDNVPSYTARPSQDLRVERKPPR